MGYLRLGLNLHITRLPIFLANLKRIGYEKSKIKEKTRHNKTGCIKQNIETRSTAVRSSDTVSMRITPNGSCRRPTNNKEDPYNGII